MFRKLDLYLLDKVFNPTSIRLYKRSGVSNFTVSKYLVMFGTVVLMYYLLTGKAVIPDPIFLSFICLMEFYFAFSGIKAAITQETKWKNLRPGTLPENFRDAPRIEVENRQFFLYITVVFGTLNILLAFAAHRFIFDLYRFGAWIPILSGFYFLGCTPPGPRDRQEREAQKKAAYASG